MTKWPDGYDRVIFDQIDSTNLEANRRVATTAGCLWILANAQTAGVGRRGRAWSTKTGNFAATLLMPLTIPLKDAALYSFVAALSLRDAFVAVGVKPADVSLKWPNDVLLQGGKVAGILLETAGKGPSHMMIGIGVNLAHAPRGAALEATATPPKSLVGDADIDIKAEAFLDVLAAQFSLRDTQFKTAGFAAIRRDWLAHATRLGDQITARMPKETVTGRFETVDDTGALVLHTSNGLRHITAAEIFFKEG
ncbi:MAG: biotin--[acetyl-CoA-carboxylase] ligase [Rhodobacteraceae bacterium]|nr:MAG: biotin--[acetyl-CoA-carboxylase] ligase [Paracoccaceae bacterium]